MGVVTSPDVGVIVTVPLYVAGAMLLLTTAEFSETDTTPGDVPELGLTCSQLPPVVVVAAALNVVADWLLRVMFCAAGKVPPFVYANCTDCGLTPIVPTIIETGTDTEVPLALNTTSVVLYGPASSPVGSAVTVTADGVMPVPGFAFNQEAFGVTEKGTLVLVLLLIFKI
jgi:hypothetical protein